MPESTKEVTINYPTSLKLGETVYNVADTPELKAFLESAATAAQATEKNKLYATIEGQKTKITNLESENLKNVNDLKTILSEAEEMRKYYEQKKEIADANSKFNITPDAIRQMMKETFAQEVPAMITQLIDPLKNTTEDIRLRELDTYKQQRIAQEANSIFPEMITGNNREEIEASIALSKQAVTNFLSRVAPVVPETPTPGQPVVGVAPVTQPVQQVVTTAPVRQQVVAPVTTPQQQINMPSVASFGTPVEDTLPEIASISNEEFGRNREQYLGRMRQFAAELKEAPSPINS